MSDHNQKALSDLQKRFFYVKFVFDIFENGKKSANSLQCSDLMIFTH